MEEIWRNTDYDDYQVSIFGNVKSLMYQGKEREKILQPISNGHYYCVNIWEDKKPKRVYIHRLVAKAFPEICGEWFEGCVIDHLDTDTYNNIATNLRVCTTKENIYNPVTQEKLKDTIFMAKPVCQYDLDGNLIKQWNTIKECMEYGFDSSNISKCCKGKKKTHKGYIWKYYGKHL